MMDKSGHIYIGEDPKPEDVKRLEDAVKAAAEEGPEAREAILQRMEHLVSEAATDLRRYRTLRL